MDPDLIGGSRGDKGTEAPHNVFSDTFFDRWFSTQNRPLEWFFWIALNHFLHRGRDKNIERKAYFAEFGQSDCVYFTENETSNEQVLYKKYGPNVT